MCRSYLTRGLLAAALGLAPAIPLRATESARPLVVVPAGEGRVSINLRGPAAAALRQYLAADPSPAHLEKVFSFSVKRPGTPIPMLAHLEWKGDTAQLVPQASLSPGLTYIAVVNGPALGRGLSTLTQEYRVPEDRTPSAAVIEGVYPTGSEVPANLLKFYVRFSVPMAEGHLFQHARLLDGAAQPIPQALREVELWSDDHRRATVWISPGRTKQSLGLSESLGPVLQPHRSYTFEITSGLPDVHGHRMPNGLRHSFRTAGFQRNAVKMQDWRLAIPSPGGRQPLTVHFPQPLDHFLAERTITVQDTAGHPVAGQGTVSHDSAEWQFVPKTPWRSERYTLVAAGDLEDLAGNSLTRPFEATTGAAARPPVHPPLFRREFSVGAGHPHNADAH